MRQQNINILEFRLRFHIIRLFHNGFSDMLNDNIYDHVHVFFVTYHPQTFCFEPHFVVQCHIYIILKHYRLCMHIVIFNCFK